MSKPTPAIKQDTLSLELEAVAPPKVGPETLYHVGVSGGKDSSGVLLWMVRESGIPPSQIEATFCDIGNDHEFTIQHVAYLSEHVHPIKTIKPKLGFFDLAFERRRFPSTKARFCTEHLKIHPTQDRVQELKLGGRQVIAVSGVRADESLERSLLGEWDFSGNLLCYQWRPFIRWTIKDVLALHAKHGIPLNPLYGLGAKRVGCWPCIMSRKSEIRTIANLFPERINEIRAWEQKFEVAYGRYSSFFPRGAVPERFWSKPFKSNDGTITKVATIDDVVRWSMTGKGANGHYTDDAPTEPISCNSGYCE